MYFPSSALRCPMQNRKHHQERNIHHHTTSQRKHHRSTLGPRSQTPCVSATPEPSTTNSCWPSRTPHWDSTSGWTESKKCRKNTAKIPPITSDALNKLDELIRRISTTQRLLEFGVQDHRGKCWNSANYLCRSEGFPRTRITKRSCACDCGRGPVSVGAFFRSFVRSFFLSFVP